MGSTIAGMGELDRDHATGTPAGCAGPGGQDAPGRDLPGLLLTASMLAGLAGLISLVVDSCG